MVGGREKKIAVIGTEWTDMKKLEYGIGIGSCSGVAIQ